MSSRKAAKAIHISLLNSVCRLSSRVGALLSRFFLSLVKIVHRIRSGNIVSQHYSEIIKIANMKQSEIHQQMLDGDRLAVEYDIQIFRKCVLEGEQQAKCFTLALLVVVFVGIIMTLW